MAHSGNDLLLFEDETFFSQPTFTPRKSFPPSTSPSYKIPDLLSESCQDLELRPALALEPASRAPIIPLTPVIASLPLVPIAPKVDIPLRTDLLLSFLNDSDQSTEETTTTTTTKPKVKLEPRNYQNDLYQEALKNNIIAVMDTGSGKTLVAAMLISELAKRESETVRNKGERKICFFIVNNIPLVSQQAAVIRDYCECVVVEKSGSKNAKKYNTNLWDDIMDQADVVVTTAQYLLDLLRHAFVKMSRVYMLIFDECHHARGDHPYGNLLREFYHHDPQGERPKIFGMTASPLLDTGSKLFNNTTGLERLMNSLIFSVDDEKLKPHIRMPNEFVVEYNTSPKYSRTSLSINLRDHCGSFGKLQSTFTAEPYLLETVGPWGVDRYWKELVERISNPNGYTIAQSEESLEALNILRRSRLSPLVNHENYLSPKIIKLVQLLKVATKSPIENFCGIIFVQRRSTAVVLCRLLQELEEIRDSLRVQVLAGHSDESDAIMRMTAHEQDTIVDNFRSGEYNLLIATSVAEEGLDIQPCNFVLRFDPATTTISHIQSKGRARKKESRYIVLREYENRKEEATHEKIKHSEKSLKEWYQSLDPERPLWSPTDMEDGAITEKLTIGQVYKVPSTGALLTFESSTALIHQYCTALARDEFSMLQPEYNITSNGSNGSSWFMCELTLPVNAPFRQVQSDPASTKAMAKKSATFKACEALHAAKALNDHLLPAVATTLEEEESEGPLLDDGKEKSKDYPMAVPTFWMNESPVLNGVATLYGCTIELKENDSIKLGGKQKYRSMCILTGVPIPMELWPFNVYIEKAPRKITMNRIYSPLVVNKDQLEMLRHFTASTFQQVCRRSFECQLQDIPYFIAPLARGYASGQELKKAISWEDLLFHANVDSMALSHTSKDEEINDSVVSVRNENNRIFFVKKVLREYSIGQVMSREQFKQENDSCDDSTIKALQGASELVEAEIRSSNRTFAQYFKWKFNVDCPDNDVIILGERMLKMKNYLQPVPNEEAKANILPLSACTLCSVRPDVLRMSQIIPSVLYNLDAILLVHDVQAKLILENVSLEHLQVAFTTSSAHREFHYERLETLGDSFLKFVATIRLYIVNPAKDEGQLHCHRIRIISNAALLRGATALELYKYVSSQIFNRKSWRPIRFIVDGKKWSESQSHELSNKTLADVVEATMGAAYLSGGVKLGLKAAKALYVPFDEFEGWDDFYSVYKQQSVTKAMAEERSRVTLAPQYLAGIAEMESVLGYVFKDKLLFFEALTHASYVQSTSVCYQRLEFLGDAILDFQVVRYYYEKYYDAPPGAMTIIKDASVNNFILGAMSIKWGLYKYANHTSASLTDSIRTAVAAVEKKKNTIGLKGEYWNDIAMPKVLGDLVESTLGAVFVDSGFDFKVVSDLFDRLIKPTLDEHVNFDNMIIHPSKQLLERIQALGCNKFSFGGIDAKKPLLRRLGLGRQEEVDTQMKCNFKIHDKIVATATGTLMDRIKKEVALTVLAMMNRDPEFLSKICDCPKRTKNRHVSVLEKYRQE
ncbi:Dicer-like protein 1 [Entomortierella beljakovae]|nr:Dicer-like protein 1 [Entomortierella beljakovae]